MSKGTHRRGLVPPAADRPGPATGPATRRIAPFVEHVGESTAACLLAMVQGNLLVLTFAHWMIALRTGLLAGVVAAITLFFMRSGARWRIAVVVAITTTGADYLAHSGGSPGGVGEALATGIVAGALSLLAGALVGRWRPARA